MPGDSIKPPIIARITIIAGFMAATAVGVCNAEVSGTIARCAASESKDERIACLENALRNTGSPGEASGIDDAGDPAAAGNPEIPASHPAPEAAPVPAAPPTTVEAPEAAVLPAAPPTTVESAVIASPAPASPDQTLRHDTDDAAVDTLGREQVATRDETGDGDDAVVRATVVDFDFTGYRRLIVRLEDGQVWRQIDGDRTSVERGLRNEETFDVELWGTRLGGYRMRVIPLDRTLRVERVE